MFNGLFIGAAGMRAQQQNVDTIANNLANANTTGFKKGRVSFSEMMVQDASRSENVAGNLEALDASNLRHTAVGVAVASNGKIFEPGELKKTESAMDVAIAGDGFFELQMPDGSVAYSRGGTLRVNQDGQLALSSGHVLKPGINVPDNVKAISIAKDGRVGFSVAGQLEPVNAGQLELVRFANPNGLSSQGEGVYLANDDSGLAMASLPGENGVGTVSQGYLEASNVKMIDEMINLMVAQRAYEANVKIVQAADEMLAMINNLRK